MLLPKPNLHRTGPGGTKKHIKRGAKALFSLSLSHTVGRSSLPVFGSKCPHTSKIGFSCYHLNKRAVTLICNSDVFKSYTTVCSPRAVTRQGALMSVTPNLCCDETKNRGAYICLTLPKAHLTSHSRISCSRWVITPSWLSGSLRFFLYSLLCILGTSC